MDILKKIYQDFKTYYKNGHELLKKIRDIYYGAPQDVTLQWEDPDTGNIENLSIPSYSKLRDRFINDVNSAMYKEIYVDAENGSDVTGDGSSSAPFKTLNKAFSTLPPGSWATVILVGSDDPNSPVEYRIEDDIHLFNQTVYLKTDGSNKYVKITQKVIIEANTVNHAYGFMLHNSTVTLGTCEYLGYIILENPKKADANKDWIWHHKAVFQVWEGFCAIGMLGWPANHPQIYMTDEGGSNIVCINSRSTGPSFGYVNLWYLNAVIENTNCKIVDFYQGDSHSSGAIDAKIVSLKDTNGNNINLTDVISGRIIDGNTGLCKNVLSATI